VIISKHCLERFKHNPKDSLDRKRFGSIYWNNNWCCKWLFWEER